MGPYNEQVSSYPNQLDSRSIKMDRLPKSYKSLPVFKRRELAEWQAKGSRLFINLIFKNKTFLLFTSSLSSSFDLN